MMKLNSNRKSLELKTVYTLVGAKNSSDLFNKYMDFDQDIVINKIDDYYNPRLVINKVKKILEKVDVKKLTPLERDERRHMLWMWYHHAISFAIWGFRDKEEAMRVSTIALKFLPKNHSNKITKLLYLLIRDRYDEAKEWHETIENSDSQKKTGTMLLKMYKDGEFDLKQE